MDDRREPDPRALHSPLWQWKETLAVTAAALLAGVLTWSFTDSEAVGFLIPMAVVLIGVAWMSWPSLRQARAALAVQPKAEPDRHSEDRATVIGLLLANFVMTGATAAAISVPLLIAGVDPREGVFWAIYVPILAVLLALDAWVVVQAVRRRRSHG
jgi:hypothetical protein